MSNDKEHIDDIFKNHFEDYKPTPPSNVWSRVKSGLNNNTSEETLYNKFDQHQPQPPAWVWASLSNILKGRQRIKTYKRIAAAALFFAALGGLIASQFAANNTIDSLFAFEKDDNITLSTTPIKPILVQPKITSLGKSTSTSAPKNYISYTQVQAFTNNIPAHNNIVVPAIENTVANDFEVPVTAPEISYLESIFANISIPSIGHGTPSIMPENNFNYKAPHYKRPNLFETNIEIFAGVANTFRQLDNKLNATVASIRKESEESAASYQWGIKFNLIKNKILFSNGISMSEYNYKGTYQFLKEDMVNLHPNFPTEVKGVYKVEDYHAKQLSNNNSNVLTTYKFINYNTAVGYLINAGRKLNITPQIGVGTGYLMSNIGPKLQAGKPTEYSSMPDANSLSLNQRLMVSGAVALKVDFRLLNSFKVGIEPYINKQINKQDVTSPLGGQKLTAKGVNLTFSYKF
ncbi:MAG: hypothetical protein SGJ10_05630 [Bacteroidota bacterium]|nr:hypothetical protein [Bacteroidota bacterium]